MVAEWIKALSSIFMIVRLVDVGTNTEYGIDAEGRLTERESTCFEVWGKNRRCVNCISAQAYRTKGQMEKFEFIGDEVFYVISKYVEIDGRPYMLEMVNKVDNSSFTGSVDRHLFVEKIREHDIKLYVDTLTGAYNRRYYEDQLKELDSITAVAMFDLDHFKSINDNFGHLCGDEVLRVVSGAVLSSIRNTDALIRFGGDEFLIIFSKMPEEAFKKKLESIRLKIEQIRLENYPQVRVTLSIGGLMSDACNEDVLRQLDARLYEAKSERNCTVV